MQYRDISKKSIYCPKPFCDMKVHNRKCGWKVELFDRLGQYEAQDCWVRIRVRVRAKPLTSLELCNVDLQPLHNLKQNNIFVT